MLRRTGAVLGTTAIAAMALAAPAGANLAATGPISPVHHFPAWYQDTNGTKLELCLQDPNCPISPTLASFTAPNGEAFYELASATATGPAGQSADLRYAVEGAFLGSGAGKQITFGRIQATLTGMRPNSAYSIHHPFGTDTFTTDANGNLLAGARAAQRLQAGCGAVPCDFNAALGTAIGPFLQWDPAVAPAAPVGPAGERYVGNGITPHAVVGSPTRFNSIVVKGPGLPLAGITTKLWVVEGKMAGPPVPIFAADPTPGDFGAQAVGTAATHTVTINNDGLAPMALGAANVGGADFAKGADTCSGATLPSGGTCTVDVGFAPTAPVGRAGTLTVDQGGAARAVPLAGTGTPAPAAAGAVAGAGAGAGATRRVLRIGGLSAPRRLSLASALRGVRIAMALPKGTTALRYTLRRGHTLVERKKLKRHAGVSVLRVKVRRRGTYRLTLRPIGNAHGVTRTVIFRVV